MVEYLEDIVSIGKYLVGITAILGLLIIIIGLTKDRRELVTRGGYLLLLSVILSICGYLIYKTTQKRADNMIYDYIENTENELYQ